MFLWITRFAVCPCFRQRGRLGRLQGWEERGSSFCPAASPTAMAISVSPLRPCSKLTLWVFGDKILNPGMRRQEKLGQAGLSPQPRGLCLRSSEERAQMVLSPDLPAECSGDPFSPGSALTLAGQAPQPLQASVSFPCEQEQTVRLRWGVAAKSALER